jgi:hypothetical protein
MDPDADPVPPPDPPIFAIDLHEANKKLIKKKSFYAYYFLRAQLHHFLKLKSQQEVGIKVFLIIFA